MLARPWPFLVLLAACDLGASDTPKDGSVSPPDGSGFDAGPPPDPADAGPLPVNRKITLRTESSRQFLSAQDGGGQGVSADRPTAQGWETFVLVDLAGGELESGDAVAVRTSNGRYLQAENGTLDAGGGIVDASTTFRLLRRAGDGVVVNLDVVGFEHVASGGWISALNGGGGGTSSQATSFGDFEAFELELRDPPPPPPTEWEEVWQDEFDGPDIDESKWSYEVKQPGWVNHELQNYVAHRSENARIEDGKLIIEGRRDNFQGHEYSSARLHTHGKASWKEGRFEARLQVPSGRGTWPAFWMMPDDSSRGWPACGEIDVMEHVGYDSNVVHATTHSLEYNWKAEEQRTSTIQVPGATSGSHVYAIEWRPGRIDAYVDDERYFTSLDDGTGDDAWPFTKDFYLILNLAIGGDWGGAQGVDANIWPQRMTVDYVRVYKAKAR